MANRNPSFGCGSIFAALFLIGLAVTFWQGLTGTEPTPAPSVTDSPADTYSFPPAAATEEPAATTAAAPRAAFKTINLKGRGNKIAKIKIPEDAAAIAVITNRGDSNFTVWSVAADGSTNSLLVNEIGSYRGTRLFDASAGEHSVALKIESNGTWAIAVKPITSAKVWNPAKAATGTGSMVLRVTGVLDDLAVMKIAHNGASNFAVSTYSDEGVDLQVNEIGRYSGESLFPGSTILVEIEADGAWSITPG